MFLTTVHKQAIEKHFAAMRRHIAVLLEIGDAGDGARTDGFSSELCGMAAARVIHVTIECITDVGNVLIDALVMRDPSSYVDIVDILADEQVLPSEFAKELIPIISLRKLLTHDYQDVDYVELLARAARDAELLSGFESHIQAYINTL